MSDEEVEAELRKDGFDPAKLASGEAHATDGEGASRGMPETADKPVAEAKVAKVTPLVRRMRTATWLAAAAFLLVAGAVATMNREDHVASSRAQQAAALRNDAKGECAKARWRACLDRLDQADRLNPEGAQAPAVKSLRKEAEEGLGGGTGAPR